MPTQKYALESGGPKRLEISWKINWKDFTVKLDDQVIGTANSHKELKAGRNFRLPDDSTLFIHLTQTPLSAGLHITRNGLPLPGSAQDPEVKLNTAYGTIFLVAGLNIVLGLLSVLFRIEFLQMAGINTISIAFGLTFLVLGLGAKRKSRGALIIAIAILAIDGILGVILAIDQGRIPTGGIMARIFLLLPMIQGVKAIDTLQLRSS
jgi:hypothetical protein